MPVGAFYFAWVNETDTSFLPEYAREDMKVIECSLVQKEGDFAIFTLSLVNQQVGLLHPGESRWAWVSWHAPSGVLPLFFGRVVGVPTDINRMKETITLVARPPDFRTEKAALAETLKVAPYYDAIWFREEDRNDPDIVLQARTARYHVDRLSHVVTISDIGTGEDGTLEFFSSVEDHGTAVVLENSVSIGYSGAAKSVVEVRAEVSWTQRAVGIIDASPSLLEASSAAGSTNPFMMKTYTWEAMVESWPLPGDNIGGGWSWVDANVVNTLGTVTSTETVLADMLRTWVSSFNLDGFEEDAITPPQVEGQVEANWTMGSLKPTLIAGYHAERSRVEVVAFEVTSDIQPVLAAPGDDSPIILSLSSTDVGEPIDAAGAMPIEDPRRSQYMSTDRGLQSFQYLVARARAALVDSARCVRISFTVPFINIFDITLRKNATVYDERLPGGQASGKIVEYTAVASGNSGTFRCGVTIACMIGYGDAVSAVTGVQDYIVDDYIGGNHFSRVGTTVLLGSSDVTFGDYRGYSSNDDGINFFDMRPEDLILNVVITNGPTAQANNIEAFYPDIASATAAVESLTTQVCFDFKPVTGGPFEVLIAPTVGPLSIPNQFDLEAAAI